MSATVVPVGPCQNCKTLAPCRVVPLKRGHSGYECSACDEVRWGGVHCATGVRVIGYLFRDGAVCWRCGRAHTPKGGGYPKIPYLNGGVAPIYSVPEPGEVHDRHCDECGKLIDINC